MFFYLLLMTKKNSLLWYIISVGLYKLRAILLRGEPDAPQALEGVYCGVY
jgi:hypothetical protein